MKRLFFALAMMLSVFTVSAKSIVITLNDGTLVYYRLSLDTNPVMKFVEGGFTISEKDSYTFSQVKNFYLSATDDPNAVEDVAAGEVAFKSNVLYFPSASTKDVKVYNAAGVQVDVPVANAGAQTVVDLNELEKGVYVVSTGNTSFKIMKK